MTDALRKQPIACVGIVPTDHMVRFIELEPHHSGDLRPTNHGTFTIPPDLATGGTINNIPALTEQLRTINTQTQATHAVCVSWGEDALDARWRELLLVTGFRTVETVTRGYALDILTLDLDGQSVSVLDFETDHKAVLYRGGFQLKHYAYPWDVDAVLDLQDAVTSSQGEPLRMLGHLPEQPSLMETMMDDYDIPAVLVNVWRQAYDPTSKVPAISYSQSFTYATAIAAAIYGARYRQTSDEQHLSKRVLKKLVPVNLEPSTHTTQAAPTKTSGSSLQDALGDVEHLAMTTEESTDASPQPTSMWKQDADHMIYRVMGLKQD